MKGALIILGLIFAKITFSQIGVDDLGRKDFNTVKRAFSISPCEVTSNQVLTYCVENGSRTTFIFENNKLTGIMCLTAFATKYSAERELENEILNEKRSLGIEPFISNGVAIFNAH